MKLSSSLPLLLLASLYPYANAAAQGSESSDPTEPVTCISLNRLDRTEVIDDQTIAFYMRGDDVYLNRLRRTCPGLEREDRFSYRVPSRRLCRSDSISVIEDSAFGFINGASCGLSDFEPSSEEEIALMKGEELEAEITVEEIDLDE